MTEYFYDRIDNIILKTSDIEEFYNKHFAQLYASFEEYLNYNYPNLVWIANYERN